MRPTSVPLRRRSLLRAVSAATLVASPAGIATAFAQSPSDKGITIAQIVDMSPARQDVGRDFIVGARAAWQDFNARGGLRGSPVQHVTLETDGSAASLRNAYKAAHGNPACVALAGCSGDAVATALPGLQPGDASALANAAPWLQSSAADIDAMSFPIFANRQEQLAHAARSMAVAGIGEVGVVYASATEQAQYKAELDRAASELKLKLRSLPVTPLAQLGKALPAGTPAMLLFVGGTPELIQFVQGLEQQALQRYVVALADVNPLTVAQMGVLRGKTSLIATQAVPLVTSGTPLVRQYRAALSRFFDEPASPLSLAGFVASRYAIAVLGSMEGPLTRANVAAAFQRRNALDLGGFSVAYRQRRSPGVVTQAILSTDGRLIG